MARPSAPLPDPYSTTTKASGEPSSIHHRSRARAMTAPNRGPSSGLVMKSRVRPAPRPLEKKPSGPYRACLMNAENGSGSLTAGKWSVQLSQIAEMGEHLRVHADGDDDDQAQPE